MNRVAKEEPTILIIDDDAVCREFLEALLEGLNYKCITACDGEAGLAMIDRDKPGVVLLDLNMPRMDGEGFIRRLHETGQIDRIQVIVVSSEEDTDIVARSIALGADDHIVKPFDIAVLNARVQSSIAKDQLRKLQATETERLEQLVAARTRELKEANEQLQSLDRAKNQFLTVLSHELRSPLNGIEIGELLLSGDDFSEAEREELYADYCGSTRRLNKIVDHALILSQLMVASEQRKRCSISPHDLLAAVLVGVEPLHMIGPPVLRSCVDPSLVIDCEHDMIRNALEAVFELVGKFSDHSRNVEVDGRLDGGTIQIEVKSWGYSIPEKHIDKLFEIMAIPDTLFPGGDLGLAPAMARQVLLSHGGDLSADNHAENGVIFTISLPVRVRQAEE